MAITLQEADEFDASSLTLELAKPEDASDTAIFAVGCLRENFTKDFKLGPQELFKSPQFLEAYKAYRYKSISNKKNICRILRSKRTGKEILGYVEVGEKIEYRGSSDCEAEVICMFVKPSLKGRGLGSLILTSVIREYANLGRLKIGQDRIGLMTVTGNPHVRFYEKLGGVKQSDHIVEWMGGTSVSAAAILIEADKVEALIKLAEASPIQFNK